jgi:hypothetical protein
MSMYRRIRSFCWDRDWRSHQRKKTRYTAVYRASDTALAQRICLSLTETLSHRGMKTGLPTSIVDTFKVCRQGYGSSRAMEMPYEDPAYCRTPGPCLSTLDITHIRSMPPRIREFKRRVKNEDPAHEAYTGSPSELLCHCSVSLAQRSPARRGSGKQSFPGERIHSKYAVREKGVQGKGIDNAKSRCHGRSICHVHRCLRDSAARRAFSLSRLRAWRRCPSS